MSISFPSEKLEVKVKLALDFTIHDYLVMNGANVYKTLSKCRGVVKIININKDREGSEIDVENLQSLFEQMGITVDVYREEKEEYKTKENILNCVKKFVSDERLKLADIAMLFIMSHGNQINNKDVFYTGDNDRIEYDDIKHYFNNKWCPNMKDKPKLIFFQTCRGKQIDMGTKVVNTNLQVDGNLPTSPIVPSSTDLLVACSTIPEHVAGRWEHLGSIFIYKLCEEFMKNAYRLDVATMLDNIYIQMSQFKHNYKGDAWLQTGDYTKTAFVKCFLNPGVYRDDNNNLRNIFTDELIKLTPG